jgi:hypothetical protein
MMSNSETSGLKTRNSANHELGFGGCCGVQELEQEVQEV